MGDSRNAFLEIGSTNRSIYPELSDTELEVQARSTHEQALEQLKEAIRLSPYDASNYFAFTASKFLDYQVIKSRYQRGLQLDYTHAPEFASNHWDFAMLASQQGFHQDAQDAFLRERLVRLDMDGNRSSTHQPSVQPALNNWLIGRASPETSPTDALWMVGQTIEIVPLPGEVADHQPQVIPVHEPEPGRLTTTERLSLQDINNLHKGLAAAKNHAREQSKEWGKSVLLGLVSSLTVFCIGLMVNDLAIPNNSPSAQLQHTINTIVMLVLIAGGFFAIFWIRGRRFSGWISKAEDELSAGVNKVIQQEPALVERLGGPDALLDANLIEAELLIHNL